MTDPSGAASARELEPKSGKCCSCGYEGVEESRCLFRADYTHCEHWWDGPDE